MWASKELYDRLLDNWEQSETSNGIPYYLNHKTERTQWDHPFFVKTLEELDDFNNVRYAAYRTALKLRFIQKRLCLDLLDIHTIHEVFEARGIKDDEDPVLDISELTDILNQMLYDAKLGYKNLRPDQASDLLLNWILNLYDMKRTGCIRAQSVKLSLIALCSARLAEKYKVFFHQLSDHNNHVNKKKMTAFLVDLMRIPDLIDESRAFGGLNVAAAVDNCFDRAWSSVGVSQESFIDWLLMEPQTLLWLPTMHRLAAAESSKHESKCNICKAFPIIGFRYRCLKCFNYDLCQNCFFTGRCSKKHKTSHPTQEYCLATSSKEDTKAFLKTVRNNLSKKHLNPNKQRYLPIKPTTNGKNNKYVPQVSDEDVHKALTKAASKLAEAELDPPVDTVDADLYYTEPPPVIKTSPAQSNSHHTSREQHASMDREQRELEGMVYHLEEENKELLQEIENLYHIRQEPENSESDRTELLEQENETLAVKQDILEEHNEKLENQVKQLITLVKKLNVPSPEGSPDNSTSQTGSYNVQPSAYTSPGVISRPQRSSVRPPAYASPNPSFEMPDTSPRRPHVSQGPMKDISNLQGVESRLQSPPVKPVSQPSTYQPLPSNHATPHNLRDIVLNRNITGTQPYLSTTPTPHRNLTLHPSSVIHSQPSMWWDSVGRSLQQTPNSQNMSPTNEISPNSYMHSDVEHPRHNSSKSDTFQDFGDSMFDSTMNPLSQTHFSLPSFDQTQNYADEEAELEAMIARLDSAYPANMSRSILSTPGGLDRGITDAAGRIGDAMTGLVGHVGHK
ncbi:unnamed protein product [Owenia fusiformis]|uniref:Dystrophin n=1 Tax=Owenia fusiformis TaxID=6347 RepID=A0A8S4N1L2_OWEFU|nr:unnamed protein product [Owenia fusiformis]